MKTEVNQFYQSLPSWAKDKETLIKREESKRNIRQERLMMIF
jgi:hypothetical protein